MFRQRLKTAVLFRRIHENIYKSFEVHFADSGPSNIDTIWASLTSTDDDDVDGVFRRRQNTGTEEDDCPVARS